MADDHRTPPDELEPRLIARLAAALKPAEPDAATRARLRGRIMAHAGVRETEIVRAGTGEWRQLLPGIRIKSLRLDRAGGTQTSLWQLEPGSRIPGHVHTQEEECLVIEGSIQHGEQTYVAGDYLYAPSGARHLEFFTATGATLLIRSEVVPETGRLTRFLYGLFKS